MSNSRLFIQYNNFSGKASFFCDYAENERYMAAFRGETFGLVDRNGHEYSACTCFDAKSFLSLIADRGYESAYDLNGAFAAAIYDKGRKTLQVLNDRFGILPIYVAAAGPEEWLVSSDVRDMKGRIALRPDYTGIAEYLTFDYCLEDRTFFQDVKYMLPGQELVFSASGREEHTYFELPPAAAEKEKSRREYIDELDDLYCHAIAIRKADENIIGLTGGLDSRLILAILGGKGTHTYNFGNLGSGDEQGASRLAEMFHTDHHYLSFADVDVAGSAREIVSRCGGQCPWERFYVLNSAREKALVPGAAEISGMGGDAISGQKSNFTGLIPLMGRRMTEGSYTREENRLIGDIVRGRIPASNASYYGRRITECGGDLKKDFLRAARAARSGTSFGNYTMRLKLRTLERRVTASSMWLTGQFLPIRFPIYDYSVLNYFNRLPQKYRYGQNLYIDYICEKYPRAAEAPHSETGHRVDNSHVFRTDYVTVRNYVMQKYLGQIPAYTNSFGFVNDRIRECKNIKDLISNCTPTADGLFDITAYGDVDGLLDAAFEKGGAAAMKHLKNIIHISLMNECFFDGEIDVLRTKR